MNLINKSYNLFLKYFVLIFIKIFLILAFLKTHNIYGSDKENLFKQLEISLSNQNAETNKYKKTSENEKDYFYFKEQILDVADEELKLKVKENYIPIFFDHSKTDEEIVEFLREISEETLVGFMNETYDNRNKNILDFFVNLQIDCYEDFKKNILDDYDSKMIISFKKNFISNIIFNKRMTNEKIMELLRNNGEQFCLYLVVGGRFKVYRNEDIQEFFSKIKFINNLKFIV
ncbi:hypothetical protein [Candidatus Phytoplasma oryzae]|nr:hypothetical protein PIE28_02060 [Candidatus Phytoplasma oryzae]